MYLSRCVCTCIHMCACVCVHVGAHTHMHTHLHCSMLFIFFALRLTSVILEEHFIVFSSVIGCNILKYPVKSVLILEV